ncbi:MAG TPA: Txe/YoeB family addiction module toxin [Ignavibacteriaceae bacterium]|mgnify:FL=1|nr:Txe/YoeB family addiction module toxin [Ignavibacteriaceae bacterium]HRQ54450.1 Txe/YoeB family addiction module toxin [Ignavibacteriaceae bacterium]
MQSQFVFDWTNEALQQLDSIKTSKNVIDKKFLLKLASLLESMQSNPFKGIGKPEPLKHNYPSFWSKRITHKDRIIYRVERKSIIIISILGHYND